MNVALIGGGVGGLVAALYLHRQGIPCQVYEAASEFKALGVGINLQPHALRRLADLGLRDAIAARGVEPEHYVFFNRHGQFIYSEPCGTHAGYASPHYSIHRADLHTVLVDAVRARLGADAIRMGHACHRIEQDEEGVTVFFAATPDGRSPPPARATIAIGCDGIHSAVRRQFYPDEGPPAFGGINMWRGVTLGNPFLSGPKVVRVGPLSTGKLVIYPIRRHADGTQLINWVAEVRMDVQAPNDWSKPGRLEDFLPYYQDSHFDWLDIPDLLRRAQFILEYPMVDRDPLPKWSFGRVTLLGDAAHPMYPRGGNGGAQAIVDAELIAELLARAASPEAALQTYEKERLDKTARIVLMNRSEPPDHIIETVEQLTQGKPFERIEDVISTAALRAIYDRYRTVTDSSVGTVNR